MLANFFLKRDLEDRGVVGISSFLSSLSPITLEDGDTHSALSARNNVIFSVGLQGAAVLLSLERMNKSQIVLPFWRLLLDL